MIHRTGEQSDLGAHCLLSYRSVLVARLDHVNAYANGYHVLVIRHKDTQCGPDQTAHMRAV